MTAVTLVSGEDPALVNLSVSDVADAELAGEDRSLALEELGGEELTPAAVVDAALTPPFLTARRVLVVREVGRWTEEDVAPLVAYLADPLETTSLVLVAGGGRTARGLSAAAKKAGQVLSAGLPNAGRARTSWVTERLSAAPLRFDAPAGSLLAEHLGEDLGRLPAIVDALVSTYGEGARIGVEQVEPFLGEAGGVAPWDLTDAIDRADTAAALAALHRLTGAGERHPLVVLATLHGHYASMLKLDGSGIRAEADAATALGIHPFRAKKLLAQTNRLGSAAIGRAICLLADADLDLRGLRNLPEDVVLDVLVARLSRLAPPPRGGRVRP
jgi:DNA polymerase-3 subunit delta